MGSEMALLHVANLIHHSDKLDGVLALIFWAFL
jgi:hypothetical protein